MYIDTLILLNMIVYTAYNKLRSWRTAFLYIGAPYIGYHILKQLPMHFGSSQLRDAFSQSADFLRETVTGANWESIGWRLVELYWPFIPLLLLLDLAVAYLLKFFFNIDEMMVICTVPMVCNIVESFWPYLLLCISPTVFGYVPDLLEFGNFVMSNRIIFGGQVIFWLFTETTVGAFWLNTSLVFAWAAVELFWPFIGAVVILGPFYYFSPSASRLERSTFLVICLLSLAFVVVVSWGFFHSILGPAVGFGWTWLQQKFCPDCEVNYVNLAPGTCGPKSTFLDRPPQPEPGWKINYAPGFDGTPFYGNNRA